MDTHKISAEIITVGNELLNGRTENTNASFLSRELQKLGFEVTHQSTVADDAQEIVTSLRRAIGRSGIIVYSGGLGPTDDDLTKETISAAIGMRLAEDPETMERIRAFFESRGRELGENVKKQALVPQGATILENDNGTAPGLYIRKGRQVIMMLPGPPHELEPMFREKAVPHLKELTDGSIYNLTLGVCGIGESDLELMIKDKLYGDDPHAALYAKEGEVEVSITAYGETDDEAQAKAENFADELEALIGDSVYTRSGEDITQAVVRMLLEKKETVALAESCTGGMVSKMITDVPGSSAVFEYGIASYGDWVKNASLGVDNRLLKQYTAISSVVGAEMARGARRNGMATYGIGITGIAGPGVGDYLDKEVGLVYIAVCNKKRTIVKEFRFGDRRNRDNIRRLSAKNALDMLRRFMNGLPIEGGVEFSNRKIADLERKDNPRSKIWLFARKAVSVMIVAGISFVAGYYGIRTVQAIDDKMTYTKIHDEFCENVKLEDNSEAVSALKDHNDEFCGWVSNKDESIDTVVVTEREDGFYSNHDFFKSSNKLGCAAVTSGTVYDSIPRNISIGGSSKEKNVIFFNLPGYRDIEYAKQNDLITYYGENFTAHYKVVSAFLLDENEGLDDVFINGDLSDDEAYFKYILNLKMRSFYDVNKKLTTDEKFLTLYTDWNEWEGARLVVCACLVDDGFDEEYVMTENDVVLYPSTWYEMKGTQSGINTTAEADRWYEWVINNSTENSQDSAANNEN